MIQKLQEVAGVVLSVIGCLSLLWLSVRGVKNSEDPAKLLFKIVFSAALVAGETLFVRHMTSELRAGGPEANIGPALLMTISIAICGIVLSVAWVRHIGDFLISPLTDMIDGGRRPPEPKPVYSIALAKRKLNRPLEAILLIREQLDRFPNDYEGILLLASIQAEDTHDLQSAEMTLNHFCELSGAAPKQVAAALTQLADWHFKLGQDTDSARAALEKIIAKFPETELSANAAQRIAHLGGTKKFLLAAQERRPKAVPEGIKSAGLRDTIREIVPEDLDPGAAAAEFVQHLREHPLDTEAREKLAVLYATHYRRLDLATMELNQLVEMPGQPAKRTAHWLNLLADLQVRGGAEYETVQGTLAKIVEKFPDLPVANVARSRLARLRLEIKGQKESPNVKLGVYEQNLGLRGRRPQQ